MAFTPFTESDQPTMAAFNEKFQGIIEELVGQLAKIETGSYVGTGTYGAENPNTLTFSFVPKCVFVGTSLCWIYGQTDGDVIHGTANKSCVLAWTDKTLTWYNADFPHIQFNMEGTTYHYVAIG